MLMSSLSVKALAELRLRFLNLLPSGQPAFDELVRLYEAEGRHYHTLQHIHELFIHLDQLGWEVDSEFELAVFAHDVIYDSRRSDNEEASAAWAEEQFPGFDASRMRSLILATKHGSLGDLPFGLGTERLVDLDLSIFAAEKARFEQYCGQVAQEYAWVPAQVYLRERVKVLKSFLSRKQQFVDPELEQRWGERARANLEGELVRLQAREREESAN